MKVTFNIMDHTGHTAEVLELDNAAAVAKAMERFNQLVGEHKMIAAKKLEEQGKHEVVKNFDPTVHEYIFSRQLVGG